MQGPAAPPHEQQQQQQQHSTPTFTGGGRAEQEGWGALPAELLALIFQALLRLTVEQYGGPASGTITLGEAAALLAACSPCRHWRHTALDTVS